ncbi:hypothetical protein VUR80DRAFT_1930 [Thermomyces stellatus]
MLFAAALVARCGQTPSLPGPCSQAPPETVGHERAVHGRPPRTALRSFAIEPHSDDQTPLPGLLTYRWIDSPWARVNMASSHPGSSSLLSAFRLPRLHQGFHAQHPRKGMPTTNLLIRSQLSISLFPVTIPSSTQKPPLTYSCQPLFMQLPRNKGTQYAQGRKRGLSVDPFPVKGPSRKRRSQQGKHLGVGVEEPILRCLEGQIVRLNTIPELIVPTLRAFTHAPRPYSVSCAV